MKNLNHMLSAERYMVFVRNTDTSGLYCLTYVDHTNSGLYAWPAGFDSFELVTRCGMRKEQAIKFVAAVRKFPDFFKSMGLNVETLFVRKVVLGLRSDDLVDKKVVAARQAANGTIQIFGSTCHHKSSCISFVGETRNGEALAQQLVRFCTKTFGITPKATVVGAKSENGKWRTTVHLSFELTRNIKLGTVRRIVQDQFSGL